MANIYGWLAPSGNFIKCSMYEHIATVAEYPEMRDIPEIAVLLCDLEDIERSCQELIDKDEHPGWHCYELAQMRARPEIIKHLYRNKFIRVGQHNNDFHFEGFPNVLKARYQACKDLADQYAAGCVFEPKRNPN